jgi:hypothetical protein
MITGLICSFSKINVHFEGKLVKNKNPQMVGL